MIVQFGGVVGRLAAMTAVGVLLLSACGTDDEAATADGSLAVTSTGATGALGPDGPGSTAHGASVPAALRFTAATVDGSTIDGVTLADRPTVAWFWTPWCAICRHEGPEVAAAQKRFGDQVNFVGIAGFGGLREMQGFVQATGVGDFPHAIDDDGSIWRGFRVIGQPSFAFIDAAGNVDVVPGAMSPSDLDKRVRQLVGA